MKPLIILSALAALTLSMPAQAATYTIKVDNKSSLPVSVTNWMGEAAEVGPGQSYSWAGEASCDYTTSQQGHYTQFVWAKTRFVGCGFRECNQRTSQGTGYSQTQWNMICNYYPPSMRVKAGKSGASVTFTDK